MRWFLVASLIALSTISARAAERWETLPPTPATIPTDRTGQAKINGISIHYAIEGNGPWLAMSHSLGCDLHMWDRETAALAGRFRVLRFDTRGHGATDAPAAPYALDQLADDLQALLDALDVGRCHFMGLSMGGMIAMTHALKYPGRFDRLLLCNTSSRFGPDAAPIWQQRIETVRANGMEPIIAPTVAITSGRARRKRSVNQRESVGWG